MSFFKKVADGSKSALGTVAGKTKGATDVSITCTMFVTKSKETKFENSIAVIMYIQLTYRLLVSLLSTRHLS